LENSLNQLPFPKELSQYLQVLSKMHRVSWIWTVDKLTRVVCVRVQDVYRLWECTNRLDYTPSSRISSMSGIAYEEINDSRKFLMSTSTRIAHLDLWICLYLMVSTCQHAPSFYTPVSALSSIDYLAIKNALQQDSPATPQNSSKRSDKTPLFPKQCTS
jgi:hypothetical protein